MDRSFGELMKKHMKHGAMALGILAGAIIISQLLSQQKEPMRRRPSSGGTRSLKLVTVRNEDIMAPIHMTGPLTAYNRIDLYAEVSGLLMNTNPPFKPGIPLKKGDVILQIDDGVYRNTVLAQRSALLNQITLLLPDLRIDYPESIDKWSAYLQAFQIGQNLAPLPEAASDRERYFIASRNIYQQYYATKSMEETLAKYVIKAPFDGVISIADVNPGALIRTGQKLGEFVGTDVFELEAAVALDEAKRLRAGQSVRMTSEDMPGVFQGSIQRVNSVIDPASMSVKVYVHSTDARLRDGMYMSGVAEGLPVPNVVSIKRDLLTNGNIYIVKDSLLALQPVSVVSDAGENIFVRGIEDGTQILGEVWQEAKPGKKIPGPEPVNTNRAQEKRGADS